MTWDLALPPELVALNDFGLEYDGGAGIDFEPYQQFLSEDETASWLRAWTGNPEVSGAELRIFGQDGTGGCAAFWLAKPAAPLLKQPVVVLGSEGEIAVIARDFADYLWLLVGGYGPMEAIELAPIGDESRLHTPGLEALAEKVAGNAPKSAGVVLAQARQEFPGFSQWIESMIR